MKVSFTILEERAHTALLLMDKAGPPCREVLEVHKEVDLLRKEASGALEKQTPCVQLGCVIVATTFDKWWY